MATVEQIRQAAEDDLITFIRLVAPQNVMGKVHEELCQWWTREDAKQNQLCLLPRAHRKSYYMACRVAWWVTKHPDVTMLYVSATSDLAEKQLYAIKNIMTSPIYRRYWPEMLEEEEGKREKWAVAEVAVDHPKRKQEGVRDATIKAVGLTSNMTGFHADVVVLDDIVVPGNAYTEDGRQKTAAAYSQLASIENPGAQEWVVGTRYHPRDIYDTMIGMKEAVYDKEGELEYEDTVYEVFQRVVEEHGEFLWPKQQRRDGKWFGFDDRELARIRAKYVDTAQFYAQYYNDANASGSERVDSSKFQYYERGKLREEEGDWYLGDRKLNVYASIDFAFSLSRKADNTALVVIGIDYDANIYVLDIDRFKTDRISDYFQHCLKAYVKWGFRKLRAEVTVAQQVIVRELKEYFKKENLPLKIDEYRPSRVDGSKEERIGAILEPRYDNLQIYHYKGGHCQTLEEELIMARPPHDDIKDALAAAVDIAVPPKKTHSSFQKSNIIYHSRFGGVAH